MGNWVFRDGFCFLFADLSPNLRLDDEYLVTTVVDIVYFFFSSFV